MRLSFRVFPSKRIAAAAEERKGLPYSGDVWNGGFKIVPVISYRNSFLPVITVGLGHRLKSHYWNKEKWDRFSWFGFRSVLKKKDSDWLHQLGRMPDFRHHGISGVITDVEALLIRAMGLAENMRTTGFIEAVEWYQVNSDEQESYFDRCE